MIVLKKDNNTVNLPTKYDPKKVSLYNNINQMHQAGYSQREIIKALSCNHKTVKNHINGNFDSLCVKIYKTKLEKHRDFIVLHLKKVCVKLMCIEH